MAAVADTVHYRDVCIDDTFDVRVRISKDALGPNTKSKLPKKASFEMVLIAVTVTATSDKTPTSYKIVFFQLQNFPP